MAELQRGAGMAGFRRLLQQFFGAGRIARHALALQIQHGQRHLCFAVAGRRRLLQQIGGQVSIARAVIRRLNTAAFQAAPARP